MSLLIESIKLLQEALERKSITKCSDWAIRYRKISRKFKGLTEVLPWSFECHPWLKEMHDSTDEMNVGMKAAQLGYTETLLNIVFFTMDIKKYNCLYVLPNKNPDASDFTAARFNPALSNSEHLREMFDGTDNVGHKIARGVNLYIRGSQSEAGLKSIDAAAKFFDEVEEMNQHNIPLAMERSSGSLYKSTWMVSTPRMPDDGIHKYYKDTNQQHFTFICPCCSRWTELVFPDCIAVFAEDYLDNAGLDKTQLICKECKSELHHFDKPNFLKKNQWVAQNANGTGSGWYVNQLYSYTILPREIGKALLQARIDPTTEQELYNSKMGLPHIVKDGQINDEEIGKCIKGYKKGKQPNHNKIITMGIDVGTMFHYVVEEWDVNGGTDNDYTLNSTPTILEENKVQSTAELEEVINRWKPTYSVMDANPEKRIALQFAYKYYNMFKICYYGVNVKEKQIREHNEEPTITVDRTSWMDAALLRLKNERINLPLNTSVEFKNHVKANVRLYEKDHMGNPIGVWRNGPRADHFGHALTYSEIAFSLAVNITTNQDMESPL
jgi:hypothetical protein